MPLSRLAVLLLLSLCLGFGSLPVWAAEPEAPATAAKPSTERQPDETPVYKTVDGRALHLLVYKPAGWKSTDTRPVFVFIHGGAWVSGNPHGYGWMGSHFAERGMVAISVEYRLIARGDKGAPTTCCADAKSALRYVRSHATELGIDPQRIVASGGSAGGHLAAFTALVEGQDDPHDDRTISPKPQALVLFNPVLDNGPKDQGGWGGERVGDRVKEFSPAHNVRAGAPPTLVLQGRNDKLIPVSTIERFQAAMKAAGARCDVVFYDGQPHGFFNKEPYSTLTLKEADTFLASLGWLK